MVLSQKKLTTHLVSSNKPCSILVPSDNTHSGAVDGALFKEHVFAVVIRRYLSTPPTNGNELLLRVPLHALHNC